MEPLPSKDIDIDTEKIKKLSASTSSLSLANGSRVEEVAQPSKTLAKPEIFTFKNIKKWVKYISYALILLLTLYTIFSNVLIKNDETKKAHDSKVDYAIKSLFKVVQMTNGMPSIGEISLNDNSDIDEIGSNIDQFINAIASVTTTQKPIQ